MTVWLKRELLIVRGTEWGLQFLLPSHDPETKANTLHKNPCINSP